MRALAVQRFDDAAQIQPVGLDAENAHAAHAIERLQDDVLVLGMKGAYRLRIAGHQRGADVLRELHNRQLLGVVAQRTRLVEYLGAFALGLLQQVRGVKIFAVKRRVFAHDDSGKAMQRQHRALLFFEPVLGLPGQGDTPRVRLHHAALLP